MLSASRAFGVPAHPRFGGGRFSPSRMRLAFRLYAKRLFLTLAAAGVVVAVFAGRILYAEDPLDRADVLYVLAGARADRWLEAAELFRGGYAPRIVLGSGGGDAAERLLAGRGVRLPTDGELARDGLLQLGVPPAAIIVPDSRNDNTAEESSAFARIAATERWRSVIVVTSKFHTRRAGYAMRRALRGTGMRVIVRASRYDTFRTGAWWTDRHSVRMVLFELPKLIAYVSGLED